MLKARHYSKETAFAMLAQYRQLSNSDYSVFAAPSGVLVPFVFGCKEVKGLGGHEEVGYHVRPSVIPTGETWFFCLDIELTKQKKTVRLAWDCSRHGGNAHQLLSCSHLFLLAAEDPGGHLRGISAISREGAVAVDIALIKGEALALIRLAEVVSFLVPRPPASPAQ